MKDKGINVLSLFDGISCGKVALDKLGINVRNYFSSEIDKTTIKVSENNYPDIIRLGDVGMVCKDRLPKIDLLLGGSPCQGFSFSGKQLNFDDPRSKLFFEYVKILKEVKPKYFLLENVPMKKWCQDIISEHLGVQPITINSSLVSAQSRKRLYWTNIPDVIQPEDKGIMLTDILEPIEIPEGFKIRNKSKCVRVGGRKSPVGSKQEWDLPLTYVTPRGVNKGGLKEYSGKSPTITTSSWEHNIKLYQYDTMRRYSRVEGERLQTLPDGYCKSVSDNQAFKLLGNGWTVSIISHILSHAIF